VKANSFDFILPPSSLLLKLAASLFHKWKSEAAFIAVEKSKRTLNRLNAMRVFHPPFMRQKLSFFAPHGRANEGLAI